MPRNTAARKSVRAPSPQELVLTRVIDAPRSVVFKAWVDPELIARWWGPKGFTMPFCQVEARIGGEVRYCMRSPEGRDYWGKGVFREIVEPEKLVFTDVFSDENGNTVKPAEYGMSLEWPEETLVTVTFAAIEGKTEVTVRQSVSESIADKTGARQGWAESLDRLAEYLSKA
jgi:uncharacterized protein YndB with AHSA1/START domain